MRARFPKPDEFRSLGSLYTRFRWYSIAVADNRDEVVVTLEATDWRRAFKHAAFFAILWSVCVGLSWLARQRPLHYPQFFVAGALVSLWPLYVPLLRLLILKRRLPFIRFDKERCIVHLLGESRHVPIEDVVAICDVVVRDERDVTGPGEGEGSLDKVYELQLVLKRQAGFEFLLLSGRWHYSAEKVFSPITSNIASCLGVPHLSINALDGTIVERSFGYGAADNAL